jgi:serine/threonine protein kinase
MSIGSPSQGGLPGDSYTILERIDDEGQVFKAHDLRRRRVVVLKFLMARSPHGGALKKGIAAARRIEHPNIVATLGAGADRGNPFLVRDYVEGSDLGHIVRHRGPLPLGQAIDLLIQAARGLEVAHAHGIIFRDLRPSKLMLDTTGKVRLLGVAEAGSIEAANRSGGEADRGPDETQVHINAVEYVAPESVEDPRRADARVDIYSLGCILYFLLTGRAPFAGPTLPERLMAHQQQPIPRLLVLRPDAPTALEELFQRMMAKQPADRPASMTEVIDVLESCEGAVAEVSPTRTALPHEPSRPTAPSEARSKKQSSAPTDGRDAPTFTQGDESEGLPVGPEFSLEGLGIDVRPRTAPTPSASPPIDRAIRIPVAGANRSQAAQWSTSLRVGRPTIVVGLMALAAFGVLALRLLLSSGEKGRTTAPPGLTGHPGGPVSARETAVNPPSPPAPEWISRTIFDGKTARGWMLTNRRPLPRKHVQPDGLNPHGAGSYLIVHEQKLGDFILDFDYKLSKGCNSGVFLRVSDLDDPVNTGIEVSLQDSAGSGIEDPGAIYGLVAPSMNVQRPAGEWNHMTITARGPVIAVSLNGTGISRINLDEWTVPGKRPDGSFHGFPTVSFAKLPRSGYLGFQDLIGDCWFRNIVLKTPASSKDVGRSTSDEACSGESLSTQVKETDALGPLPLIEVTSHRVADVRLEPVPIIGLGKDRGAERPGGEAAFRSFLNDKNQLIHKDLASRPD